ncbi:MAG TPA: (d)CMP kinase [Actinobacteria bacterium]|jgi:cytidylate kinase|nr:(d)CMP kinase [Actinomycetota bacterium]
MRWRPGDGQFAGKITVVTNSAASAQRTTAGGQDHQAWNRGTGLVIAVDGPAGSGKSSAARGAARALGLRYLDTGAMYRALTWWLLAQQVDTSDADAVRDQLGRPVIEIGTDPAAPQICVDGLDVAGPIRSREVSNAVSAVARVPQVRQRLIAQQQAIIADAVAAGSGIVAEGRDVGTVVAPDAPVKVYLTASESARARRRTADLAGDPAVTPALTQQEQARRDAADAAQMARARDAVEIDTTALSLDEVIAQIVSLARGRSAVPRG